MQEVRPGVFITRTRHSANSYLIFAETGPRAVLVDPGSVAGAGDLIRTLVAYGLRPNDLVAILLTHTHPDHAGAAAQLWEWSGAPVYVHPAELGRLRQGSGPPLRWLGRLRIPPVLDAKPLADGASVPGFESLVAVHTPGHSPGHLCFFLPEQRIVFLGDLLLRVDGRLARPVGLFGRQGELHLASLKRLLRLGAEAACFGHGEPILRGFSVQLATFLEGLRPEPEWLRLLRHLPDLLRFGLGT